MTSDAHSQQGLRQEFLSRLERGELPAAIQAARALLRQESGLRQWSFIRSSVEKAPAALALQPLKVALLSSFSIDFVQPALVAQGFVNGIKPVIYQSSFSQFRQEILDSASSLYSAAPDVVILAVEGKHASPHLYENAPGSDVGSAQRQTLDELGALMRAFRHHSSAALLIHNFAPPVWPFLGIADAQSDSQVQSVHRLNSALQELASQHTGTYIVDYASLVNRHGALHWYDERMDLFAKAPIAQNRLGDLAAEYMKYFRALTGQVKKCLVLDLDNTLWGGIVGEDGCPGIQLGPDYPGSAFVAFQKSILDLHHRGVLLAIASKNNPADVEEVFSSHPHMILRKEHFSNMQVSWAPKDESLRKISQQLSIGLEHMVFADDNPAEIEQIQRTLPIVTTLALPKQPEDYRRVLLEEGLFDSMSVSKEDGRRGELYKNRARAEALREQSGSLEDYYRGLEMEMTLAPVDAASLARAAQLTQKTNQFNVTTIRYSEAQLKQRMGDPAWQLATVAVRDRFGDTGIVGLMVSRVSGDELEIDTFLLSCRVIGRTVETAMLAFLSDYAVRQGLRYIRGRICPTPKNVPVRDLFSRHGFTESGSSDTESIWRLEVAQRRIPTPEWIQVKSCQTKSDTTDAQSVGVEHAGSN
jgi:FkbH-like protein